MSEIYESRTDVGLAKSLRAILYSDRPEHTIPILAEALARLLESKSPFKQHVGYNCYGERRNY